MKFEGKRLDLLLIEATQGFTSASASYIWKSKNATKHREIFKVAYHCFDFNINGKDQAKNFLSLLDTDHASFKRGSDYSAIYLNYELYLETCTSKESGQPDIIEEQIQDFMDAVEEEGYIKPFVMLSQGFIKIMDEELVEKLGKVSTKPCPEDQKEIEAYKEYYQLEIEGTPIEEFATLFEVWTDWTFETIKGTACWYIRLRDLPQEEPLQVLNEDEINKRREKWDIFKPYMHGEIDKPYKNFNTLQKFYGIDVSVHQKEIDWKRVKNCKLHNRELAFVFIRATNGLKNIDPCYKKNIKGVTNELKNIKLKWAYHFFWVKKDIKAQVEKFDEMIQESGYFDKENDWIALDVEHPDGGYSETAYNDSVEAEPSEWTANVRTFMDKIGEKGYKNKIIYINCGFWETNFLKDTESLKIFEDCLLWITYLNQEPGKIEKLWDHYRLPKYKNPTFIQFSKRGKVDGIKPYVDLNLVSDEFAKDW